METKRASRYLDLLLPGGGFNSRSRSSGMIAASTWTLLTQSSHRNRVSSRHGGRPLREFRSRCSYSLYLEGYIQ